MAGSLPGPGHRSRGGRGSLSTPHRGANLLALKTAALDSSTDLWGEQGDSEEDRGQAHAGQEVAGRGDPCRQGGRGAWTKAELDEVLNELHAYADRSGRLHDQEIELAGLMRDAGDGAGQDQADLGATSFERDHELTVVNNSARDAGADRTGPRAHR